jgi:cellulose biosynthesis protein BcsQ
MKIVALFSLKGGVGKSTLALHLAHMAASAGGRRTVLWDLDSQGAATFLLGADPPPDTHARRNLSGPALDSAPQRTKHAQLALIAADKSLRHLDRDLAGAGKRDLARLAATLAPHCDRLILDCPPGHSALAEQLFRAADLIVEPIVPTPLAERAHAALVAHLAKHHRGRPQLLPVFNMADRRRALHAQALAAAPDRPVVPFAAAIERISLTAGPVPSGSPASRAFAELWAAAERRLIG